MAFLYETPESKFLVDVREAMGEYIKYNNMSPNTCLVGEYLYNYLFSHHETKPVKVFDMEILVVKGVDGRFMKVAKL